MLPCIEIKLDGILHNLEILKDACGAQGISFTLVTKVLGGHRDLVKRIIENGQIHTICDSRIQNLMAFQDLQVEKWLIRSPMISEADQVVSYADVSLNTESSVLLALNQAALQQNRIHKVILMYECGDLREGCYVNELVDLITLCDTLDGIEVYGIGTNLSCLNDVLPSDDNMAEFANTVAFLENKFNRTFQIISGGASSSVPMLVSGKLPKTINNLRMGEAVFLGNIPVYDKPFDGAREDNFVLKTEILELKEKPASPLLSPDSSTLRQRAIVAIGKQDIYLPGLSCVDCRMKIIGGSSDHIILDVTDCGNDYKVGSVITFKMNYNCLLNAMTSPYIEKQIL